MIFRAESMGKRWFLRGLVLVWLHLQAVGTPVMAQGQATAQGDPVSQDDPSGVTDVVRLDEPRLVESSGLAISNRVRGVFWTHNDSGGDPVLYAFDRTGRKTGQVTLEAVTAYDWEDMASFQQDGVPRLLVADCGDNDAKRSHIRLYLFDEPDPLRVTRLNDQDFHTLGVTYEDGPRDCEAVAVDLAREVIVLVSKGRLPLCGVYTIPLPRRGAVSRHSLVTAKRVTSLPIPMVTAMDIDPTNGDYWLVSYFHALRFRSGEKDKSLRELFSTLPDTYDLPRWRQIEAVAIDEQQNVWLTSEGRRTPLGRLPAETRKSVAESANEK